MVLFAPKKISMAGVLSVLCEIESETRSADSVRDTVDLSTNVRDSISIDRDDDGRRSGDELGDP
jgi:hypothetical protein